MDFLKRNALDVLNSCLTILSNVFSRAIFAVSYLSELTDLFPRTRNIVETFKIRIEYCKKLIEIAKGYLRKIKKFFGGGLSTYNYTC